MPAIYNTGDWITLGPNVAYRKCELYSMEWPAETELAQMNVVAAPYGGPMAIVRQTTKVGVSPKPIIRIFTASGHLISTIQWNSGNLLTFGWSDSEELLCVQDDGLVLIYDMFGHYKHTFSMGHEAKDTKVIDARIFPSSSGTGVAVMTTNFRIFLINSIKDPKIRQLPEMPKSILDPTCWTVVAEEQNTYCLVARERELFKLRQGDSVCLIQNVSFEKEIKSIIAMSVSYNNKYLALYTNNGIIWMGSSDLKTKYCEFNTTQQPCPKQIEWIQDSENCYDSNAVIIAYPSLILVVTINGESNMYSYDPDVFLIPEMDCVRILTNNVHEVIQKVPKSLYNIFAINSDKPSSWLLEAYIKYQDKSQKSDEYLCMIKDKLNVSVSECIEAAGYEFDTETQKHLIRTAHFGKAFIPAHNPDEYIKISRILRVLNSLRDPKIGIPLTYKQFCHLKPCIILDRLVFRKHYGLAIQLAKHLKISEARILEHWAFHKVAYDKNDDEIARKISEKLRSVNIQGISFCSIAKKAQELGKNKLAIKLLELEPKSSLQVPLLLKLGENKKALLSATQSGDTDLVYTVLMELKKSTQLAEFQMIIRTFPMAQNLYKKYCYLNSKSTLQEIFNQEDDFIAQAEFALREGISKEDTNLESSLPIAAIAYKKGHKDIEAELCDDARKLLKEQKSFGDKYTTSNSGSLYGRSLHDTIKILIERGDLKQAEKLKNEYKMPDKRYWWIRIQELARTSRWDDLEKFSKSKKSPIGYEPFVEVCLKYDDKEEAKKYLPKCRDERKIKLLTRAGLLYDAALVSFEQKDLQSLWSLHVIATKNGDPDLIAKVDSYTAALSGKRNRRRQTYLPASATPRKTQQNRSNAPRDSKSTIVFV